MPDLVDPSACHAIVRAFCHTLTRHQNEIDEDKRAYVRSMLSSNPGLTALGLKKNNMPPIISWNDFAQSFTLLDKRTQSLAAAALYIYATVEQCNPSLAKCIFLLIKGVEMPEEIGIHPPSLKSFLNEENHDLMVFPWMPVLLELAGLPMYHPQTTSLFSITHQTLQSNTKKPNNSKFGHDFYESAAYKEILDYLSVDKPTIVTQFDPQWIEEGDDDDGLHYSLSRKWITRLMAKMYARVALRKAPNVNQLVDILPSIEGLLKGLSLKFSPVVLREHSARLAHETEVEPYLTESHKQMLLAEYCLGHFLHYKSIPIEAKVIQGWLHRPSQDENIHESTVLGGLLFALALNGVQVMRQCLYAVDVLEVLRQGHASLTSRLLQSLALNALTLKLVATNRNNSEDEIDDEVVNEDLERLVLLHLPWQEDFFPTEMKANNTAGWLRAPSDNTPLATQTSALLAMGLLHFQCHTQWLSRRLLHEMTERKGMASRELIGGIPQSEMGAVQSRIIYDDAWRMASAIAYGLINLHNLDNCDLLDECLGKDACNSAVLMAVALSGIDSKDIPKVPLKENCSFHYRMLRKFVQSLIEWREATGEQLCTEDPAELIGMLLYAGIKHTGHASNTVLINSISAIKEKYRPTCTFVKAGASYEERLQHQRIAMVYDHCLLALSLVLHGTHEISLWKELRSWWRHPQALNESPMRARLHNQSLAFLHTPKPLLLLPTNNQEQAGGRRGEFWLEKALLVLAIWPEDDAEGPDELQQFRMYPKDVRHWWLLKRHS